MVSPNDDEIIELEWQLQFACAAYVSGDVWGGNKIIKRHPIPFHFLKYHHPAMEYRGDDDGNKYRKRGSTSGIPDWLLWGPNKWHAFIELKVAGRKLNPNQQEWHRWARDYGFPHAVCYTLHEFRDTIISWGWDCKNMACIEPNYQTKEQKFRASHNFYAPSNREHILTASENLPMDMPEHDPL